VKGGIFTRTDQQERYAVNTQTYNPFNGAAAIAGTIDQAMYCQTADLSEGQGFRAVYMPFDPSFEFFIETDRGRAAVLGQNADDFFWNFYIRGQANMPMTIELCWNWELEPKQESFAQMLVSKPIEGNASKDVALDVVGKEPDLLVQPIKNPISIERAAEKLDEHHLDGIASLFTTGIEKAKPIIDAVASAGSFIANLLL